jgi:hypothetical protein
MGAGEPIVPSGIAMTEDVQAAIRAKIAAGLLPVPGHPAHNPLTAAGRNQRCDGCDERIRSGELQYDIVIRDGKSVRFHRNCYWAWRKTAPT